MKSRAIDLGLAVAAATAMVCAIIFVQASGAYSRVRGEDSAQLEQITAASDRSNNWFNLLMIAAGVTTAFLAYRVAQKPK